MDEAPGVVTASSRLLAASRASSSLASRDIHSRRGLSYSVSPTFSPWDTLSALYKTTHHGAQRLQPLTFPKSQVEHTLLRFLF